MNEQSFICCSPSLALPPEPSSPPPAPGRGKIVFQETGPWCQKGWGPLIYSDTVSPYHGVVGRWEVGAMAVKEALPFPPLPFNTHLRIASSISASSLLLHSKLKGTLPILRSVV